MTVYFINNSYMKVQYNIWPKIMYVRQFYRIYKERNCRNLKALCGYSTVTSKKRQICSSNNRRNIYKIDSYTLEPSFSVIPNKL